MDNRVQYKIFYLVGYFFCTYNFLTQQKKFSAVVKSFRLKIGLESIKLSKNRTPENDEDHDLVYLKTEGGAFATSFSYDDRWEPVNDPRLSASVGLLTS